MTKYATYLLTLSYIALAAALINAQFPMAEGSTVDRERSSKNEDTTYELEARIAAMRYLIDQSGKRHPGFRHKCNFEGVTRPKAVTLLGAATKLEYDYANDLLTIRVPANLRSRSVDVIRVSL